jgi:hypothetical protein
MQRCDDIICRWQAHDPKCSEIATSQFEMPIQTVITWRAMVLCVVAGVIFAPSAKADSLKHYRYWYSESSRFRADATLVSIGPDVVGLEKQDSGAVIDVELTRLCESDQAYVDAVFRIRAAVLNLSRSPYAAGTRELESIQKQLLARQVSPAMAYYLAAPSAITPLADPPHFVLPYRTGPHIMGDRGYDFFAGRWIEVQNSGDRIAHGIEYCNSHGIQFSVAGGMQYPIAYTHQSSSMVGLEELIVFAHDGSPKTIRPEDFDKIIVMPPYWDQPTYSPVSLGKNQRSFQSLRGIPSPRLTTVKAEGKYWLVYDGRNRLWTDEAALKAHQLIAEASTTWNEADILALFAEGKWRVFQGDGHALKDRIAYDYMGDHLEDAKPVFAAIDEYTKAINLFIRFAAKTKQSIPESEVFFLGSSAESVPGPQMRAALWADYGSTFSIKETPRKLPEALGGAEALATNPRNDRPQPTAPEDRWAFQVEPKSWQVLKLVSPGPQRGYYLGTMVLDPYRANPTCLVNCVNDTAQLREGDSYLGRLDRLPDPDDRSQPLYSVDEDNLSPTYLLAESITQRADAHLRRACMYLVLGGERRLKSALDDLSAAMELTPKRAELMLPALEIRSRVYSAFAISVAHPDYGKAETGHQKAMDDAQSVVTKEAQIIQGPGGRKAIVALWEKIPPPVSKELRRRRQSAFDPADNSNSLLSEISRYAANDMDRRGFYFRSEAEVEVNTWTEAAKDVFRLHATPFISKQPLWKLPQHPALPTPAYFENIREGVFLGPINDIEHTIVAREGYRTLVRKADECFSSAHKFAPGAYLAKLTSTINRLQIAEQDAAWRDRTIAWSTLLMRLDYEYLNRYAPFLLTISEYFPAVEVASKAALLRPQVSPDRDLKDWFADLISRIQ